MTMEESKKEEKTRYSDEELEEFRQIILDKLEKAKRDLDMLTEAYTTGNEHDTNDTSPTFKVLEEGHQVLSKEENGRLALASTSLSKIWRMHWFVLKTKLMEFAGSPESLFPKNDCAVYHMQP